MAIEPRNFDHLLGGKVKGLSDAQLEAHFGLYRGYVKKLGEIRDKLAGADRGAPNYSFNDYSELKRREPVAYNGTVLHEMYFENLGDGSAQPDENAKRLLTASFGGVDAWIADAKACLMSGHGWLLTVYDYRDGRLHNNLVRTEHDVGLFANVHAMIAVDAWEHAYFFDYQTGKARYVEAVLSGLAWDVINQRLAGRTGEKKALVIDAATVRGVGVMGGPGPRGAGSPHPAPSPNMGEGGPTPHPSPNMGEGGRSPHPAPSPNMR